jgi:hypothetical protein
VDKLFAQPAPNTTDENRIKALVCEVLALIYEQRDREFGVLVSWRSKAL